MLFTMSRVTCDAQVLETRLRVYACCAFVILKAIKISNRLVFKVLYVHFLENFLFACCVAPLFSSCSASRL